MNPNQSKKIICMKWGNKYPADFVNRLYNMVKRNMSYDFDMICLTDDTKGINPKVQCYPIPEIPVNKNLPERMWKKLTTFKTDLYGLQGEALFLDLDVLIVDSLDPFFDAKGDFFIIQDYLKKWRGNGNSSVYRWTLGQFGYVYDYFLQNTQQSISHHHNEQEYLTWAINHHNHHQLQFWPNQWCPSYKYDCVSRIPFAFWKKPKLPKGSKIVIFHGEINPNKAITGGFGKWYRYVQPAPWVANYWK